MSNDRKAKGRRRHSFMTVSRFLGAVALPATVIALAGGSLVVASCGEGGAPGRAAVTKALTTAGGGEGLPQKQKKAAKAPVVDDAPVGKRIELPEAVFIENDENRDPFRSFLPVFTAQALPVEDFAPRPPVLLDDVALDELRLIGIISGAGGNPRAMVVDPDGKGWVVRRGDYMGRGERIRLGPGQPEREINWRVVRVRPDRIILVREDPVQAGPPVTRVMRLYPEEDT